MQVTFTPEEMDLVLMAVATVARNNRNAADNMVNPEGIEKAHKRASILETALQKLRMA